MFAAGAPAGKHHTDRHHGHPIRNVFTNTSGVFGLGVNWWDAPYKGSMDDLRIYGRALGDAEVSALAR